MTPADAPASAKGLGEMLTSVGALTQAQLDEALRQCEPDQRDLCEILVRLGHITEEKFLQTAAFHLGVPYFSNLEGVLELEAVRLIPEEMARERHVIPIILSEGTLTLGMVNPLDEASIEAVRAATGNQVLPVLATYTNLLDTFDRVYGALRNTKELPIEELQIAAPADGVIKEGALDETAIETVDSLLEEGFVRKASDIHLESAKDRVRVRYRIDGVLTDAHVFDKAVEATLIARIKILARLDITETRVPQDGRFQHECRSSAMDIRVSTLPTIYGEKIVMRLLISQRLKTLDELGLRPESLQIIRHSIQQPNGMILVTGPTGSGKTSTLYSCLQELNIPDRNIVTLEDPVEYRLDRVIQVEANAKVGLTFAIGLRAILRQDPNVILVGEIRDLETAEIAVQASITGHLVMSTLHTNDAVSTIHRLINMKVEPHLLAAALRLVIAQRLMRQICEHCRKSGPPTEAEASVLAASLNSKTYPLPGGCDRCFGTGYSGRIPIFEVLPIGPGVRDCILSKASVDELRKVAAQSHARTLQQEALRFAEEGKTTLAEVLRVTASES